MITIEMYVRKHAYFILLHNANIKAHIKSVPAVTKNHSRPWLGTLHLPTASPLMANPDRIAERMRSFMEIVSLSSK